jgi:two-component system chemotaxis response regulator CheB
MRPDVLTMDVRMPIMDGLEATRHIMRQVPTPIVIVTGNLMHADMDVTFEALRAGALTVVLTPGLADPEGCAKVIQSVRLMAKVPVVHHWGHKPPSLSTPDHRPFPQPDTIKMIGIAASTGGPGTLARLLRKLPGNYPIPILIVQHVSRGFVTGLAEWLNGETELEVRLANHGDLTRGGMVLIAPDDYHLQVNTGGLIQLNHEAPYKGLRPSANYLFHSLATSFCRQAAGIVLTGMGDDGAEGLRALRQAGGVTIAQDKDSCVVYGMPEQAVLLDAVDHILTPEELALALNRLTTAPQQDRKILI